jgi:hypothetical protein
MHHGLEQRHRPRLEGDQQPVVEVVEVEHHQGEEVVAEGEQQHLEVEEEVVVVVVVEEQRVMLLASRSGVRKEPLQLGVLAEEEAAQWDCFPVQELRTSTHPLRSKV